MQLDARPSHHSPSVGPKKRPQLMAWACVRDSLRIDEMSQVGGQKPHVPLVGYCSFREE